MFNAAVYAYAGACVCACGVRSLFCAANSHNILMQFKANFGVHSITYGRDRQNRLCLPSMSQHIRVLSNHSAHKSPAHPSYTPAPAHFAFRIQSHIDFGDKLRHQHGRSGLRRSQTITGISFRTAPKTAHTPHRTRPGGRLSQLSGPAAGRIQIQQRTRSTSQAPDERAYPGFTAAFIRMTQFSGPLKMHGHLCHTTDPTPRP